MLSATTRCVIAQQRPSSVRRAARHFRFALLSFFVTAAFVLSSLGLVAPASAAPFDLAGSDWEGCADLVRLARSELGSSRVVATASIDFHELRPEDGLLLLYPEKSLDDEQLSKFMKEGGRVIMMDDFGRGDSLLRHFSMERVPSPKKPAEFLRKNPQLALA